MSDQTNWNGSVWGSTTKGTIIAEIIRQGDRIQGKITLFEPGLGQLHALLCGEWSVANSVTATLHQFTGSYNIPVTLPQTGKMEGTFDPTENVITGQWSTGAGTAGKFLLVKMESPQPMLTAPSGSPSLPPSSPSSETTAPIPPLVTKTLVLGSYRLDERAIRRLSDIVKNGTNVVQPAINASHAGSEHIHIGIDNLLADAAVAAVVYNMIISASEPSVKAGTSTVTLNLKKSNPSTLFVSGYNQVWVEGKAAQVTAFLEEYESRATYILRKYGSMGESSK